LCERLRYLPLRRKVAMEFEVHFDADDEKVPSPVA
jgi:hypothetical protein